MNKNFIFLLILNLILFSSVFVLAEEKVNINTASLDDLDKIVSVGPTLAQRIIDARPFYLIDDLLKVKGIGEKTLQKIKEQGLACVNCETQLSNLAPVPDSFQNSDVKTNPTPAPDESTTSYSSEIFINEILPSPQGTDEVNEFIEIYNKNNFEVDISHWIIEDIEGTITNYTFPKNTKIYSNGYLVLKRPETKITLNNEKDGLNLMWPNKKIISSVSYEKAPKNQSYNKDVETWKWSKSITPGSLNVITVSSPQKITNNLSKLKKSDNNIATASIKDSINPIEIYNTTNDIENKKYNDTWLMFFISIIVIMVSGGILLFFKFKKQS